MAADSTVRLLVDARNAITGLRRTNQETKKLEGAVRDMNGKLRDSKGRFVGMGNSAKSASRSVGGLTKALGRLAAAAAVFQVGKFVIFKTAQLETQTRALQVLTGSLGTTKQIISELQAIGRVTPFTSTELIETAKRLKAFGFETEQLVDVTRRLADVAGATGADLDGIATAFGQIRAKGRLMGEENLQLLERGVDLQGELQKMYQMSGAEFAKAMESGRIGADAVNVALQNLTDQGGMYANGAIAQSDTLAGRFSTLMDGMETLARGIGETLQPAIDLVLRLAIEAINEINTLMGKGAEARNFGMNQAQLDRIDREAREQAVKIGGLRGYKGALDPRQILLQAQIAKDLKRAFGFATGQLQLPVEQKKADTTAQPVPELLGGTTKAGAKTREKKSPIEIQRENLRAMLPDLQNQLSLAQTLNEEERRTVELNIALSDIKRQFPNLSDEELRAVTGLTIQYHDQLKINDDRLKQQDAEAKKQKELEDQQKKAAERLAQTYQTIGDAIKTGVVDSLTAAVEGTKSLAEVASNTLRSLANTLLKLGVNTLLGSLGGGDPASIFTKLFGGGRANGGTVAGGRSYMVGERGPELFTPGRTGSIAPNSAVSSMGSIVVNVDAKGTSAQGDSSQAKLVGEAIGSAVRQELLRQKRPGGLLS